VDPRFADVLERQQRSGFPGLAGSELGGTIRMSDQLLNQLIAASLPASSPVRSVVVHSREGNWLHATVTLAKPSFLPPLRMELAIDRQPELPGNPMLVLRLSGGAGVMLRLAGSALARAVTLPPGIRVDGDRVFIDIRAMLQQHGQAKLLDFVQQLCIATEESGIAVVVRTRIA
jgi:hypothetical protein